MNHRSNADISVLSNQELLTEIEKRPDSDSVFSFHERVLIEVFQVLPAGGTPRSFQGRLTRVSGRLVPKNMTNMTFCSDEHQLSFLTMISMIITMIGLITDYNLGSGQDAWE